MLNANALVSYAAAKAELGLADDTQRAAIERRINVASQAIESHCERLFLYAAGIVEQVLPGDLALVLSRPPVLAVTQVKDGDQVLDAADYYLRTGDAAAGILRSDKGWTREFLAYAGPSGDLDPTTQKAGIEVTYKGGWVPDADPWAVDLTIPAGGFVRRSSGVRMVFQADREATTSGTEPVWPTEVGGTVTDGNGVVWTAVGPPTMPSDVEQACLETVVALHRGAGKDSRIAGVTIGSVSVQYSGRNPGIGREGHTIPDSALQLLAKYVRFVVVG